MKTPRSRHALAAPFLAAPSLVVSIVLAGSLLTGCSGDANPGHRVDTASSTPGSDTNPFTATLEGPQTGESGDTLAETLTNTGRLPDAYQIDIEPVGAATVAVSDFHLSPGESAKVQITIVKKPFEVHLKSVGGGAPDRIAMTVR